MNKKTGISNRETPEQEQSKRAEHPPIDDTPQPQDAAGRKGDEPVKDFSGRQTSHKAGSRSIAQKEAESKYADRGVPQAHKVSGAFGREPGEEEEKEKEKEEAEESAERKG